MQIYFFEKMKKRDANLIFWDEWPKIKRAGIGEGWSLIKGAQKKRGREIEGAENLWEYGSENFYLKLL